MAQNPGAGALLGWSFAVMAAFSAVVVLVLVRSDQPPPPVVAPVPSAPTAAVVAEARESAVLVTGIGCRVDSTGSGAVIAAGVVTNAHVVAGAEEVTVTTIDGRAHDAEIRLLDTELDLALLHVEGLDRVALRPAAPVGATEAVALVRGADTIDAVPVGIERTITIFTSDIYGEGRYERRGLELRADIDPGDSGAGVIDADGAVVGIVFSASRTLDDVAYAVSALELETLVSSMSDGPVDSGECL